MDKARMLAPMGNQTVTTAQQESIPVPVLILHRPWFVLHALVDRMLWRQRLYTVQLVNEERIHLGVLPHCVRFARKVNRLLANCQILPVNASIVQQASIAIEVHRTMTLAINVVCLALPGNRRLRGRLLAAPVQIVLLASTLQAEALALIVPQESIRPPLVHRHAQIVPRAKPRLAGRLLAATAQIVLLPSTLRPEACAPTALTARRHLLAQMPAALASIVLQASTVLVPGKSALPVRLASSPGQLVRQRQVRAKTVIVANFPRQRRRLCVQIAQPTPSLQPVLLPVQRVVWVMYFTFNPLQVVMRIGFQQEPNSYPAHLIHARRVVGLTMKWIHKFQ